MSAATRRLCLTGALSLLAIATLVVSRAPLGSPLFFVCLVAMAAAYLGVLPLAWRGAEAAPKPLLIAFLFALAFRLPLAIAPVDAMSDMVRYLWDGRVQQLGYNPYRVVPADPAVAHTHTDQTRHMPSLRAATPYPPAAQLFFRAVVAVRDSTRAMKIALVACDLLTIVLLGQWLADIGRSRWLVLAYAWNPLVVLEIAHSGHIDALGALWITASAWFLTRRRTALAAVALVLGIATKLLPIVLAPLYWGRIRWRDWLLGGAVLAALYLPFAAGGHVPLGALPNVVAHIRFNGPVFRAIAAVASPQGAAAFAVLIGLAAAVVARRRLGPDDPAAWAWPMALSLACAPVIYPWYLLYFTPFLWSRQTIPLVVWTLSSLPVYVVWERAAHGGRWVVPWWAQAIEFGAVIGAMAAIALRERRSRVPMDELV